MMLNFVTFISNQLTTLDDGTDTLKTIQHWLQLGIIFFASIAGFITILAAIYNFQMQKWYAANPKKLKIHQRAVKVIILADLFLWGIVLMEGIFWAIVNKAIENLGS